MSHGALALMLILAFVGYAAGFTDGVRVGTNRERKAVRDGR